MSIRADDWGRIRAVFDVAVGLSGAERQAHVDRACAQDPELRRQVEALLGSHDRADTFLETPARVLIGEPVDVPDEIAGRRIGSYQVESRIGAGGMGEVYLARDTNLE